MHDVIKRALVKIGITPETPRSEAAGALRSFGIALDTHCSDKQIMVGGSWITAQQLLDASALLSYAEAQASALVVARDIDADKLEAWRFNVFLEVQGGSDSVAIGGAVLHLDDLLAMLDALAQLNALEG